MGRSHRIPTNSARGSHRVSLCWARSVQKSPLARSLLRITPLPQTAAGVDRRLAIIDKIRDQHAGIAWSLMVSLLPRGHDTSDYAPTPTWRTWPLDARQDVPMSEHMRTVEEITTRLLADVGTD